jgi:hypothetical protein
MRTSAQLVKALASIVGAEMAAPIVREAISLPHEERRSMLESVYEIAVVDAMNGDVVDFDDPHDPAFWPVRQSQ